MQHYEASGQEGGGDRRRCGETEDYRRGSHVPDTGWTGLFGVIISDTGGPEPRADTGTGHA